MPPVKTKVLTPEPPPAGPEIPTSQPRVETATDVVINSPQPESQPEISIPEVPAPNRPGLETPPTPELAPTPDPFVLLADWSGKVTRRTLRAMPVPGGCIVRVSAAIPGNLSESICFLPGVSIGTVDGKQVLERIP